MTPALSALALVAAGQFGFGTITVRIADQTAVSVNESQCAGPPLTASFQTAIQASRICSALHLFVTDAADCPNEPNATNDLVLGEVPEATLTVQRNLSETRNISVASLPFFKKNQADGGSQCGARDVDVTHRFCATVQVANDFQCISKTTLKASPPVTIRYDTKPPGAPTIDGVEPLDGSASVSVQIDSDTSTVRLEHRSGGGDWVSGATIASTKRTEIIPGLENGTTYEVRAIAIDAAGNESAPSGTATVTPRLSEGFWAACVAAGCPQSGCSASGGPLALAGLALALLCRRIRR